MPAKHGLKLTALSVADAAKALSAASGKPVSEALIRKDIDAGAPTNADGTISLVHYAAWLAKEVANGRDEFPSA